MTGKTSITEAVSNGQFGAARNSIAKFFKKSLGTPRFYAYPTPEIVTSGGEKLVGIRYFAVIDSSYVSFRLNWEVSTGIKVSAGLKSVDYWGADFGASEKSKKTDGSGKKPTSNVRRLTLSDPSQSLVKSLPMISDLIKNGFQSDTKEIAYIEESVKLSMNTAKPVPFEIARQFLGEEVVAVGSLNDTVKKVIAAFRNGKTDSMQYSEGGGAKTYGPGWLKTVKAIRAIYPNIMVKDGRKFVVDTDVAAELNAQEVLEYLTSGNKSSVVTGTISRAPAETSTDTYGVTEDSLEKLSYTAQLESLRTGIKLLLSGATNSIFVAGRGGTGKTQNVEDELAAAGLKDGDGYTVFKGSASTAGLYRAFFQNRNGILFFDDADGALADQDSRNLFKAASDTKKVRKLSWQKAGGGYVDPEDFDFDNEEEQDKLPRSFEFKGKIIFISNLSMNKLDPDGALRTRGYIIPVDPTDQDMIDFMRKIADNIPLDVNYVLDTKDRNEVVDIIASKIQGVDTIKSKILNLRMLVKALNIRAGIESAGGSKQEWVNFVQRFI
jgi:hypothetical protein